MAVIQSVPGVDVVTTSTEISDLSELGTLNRSEIAKLAGVAPIADPSGRREGTRSIVGGRSYVRRLLDMAALTATRFSSFKARPNSVGAGDPMARAAVTR